MLNPITTTGMPRPTRAVVLLPGPDRMEVEQALATAGLHVLQGTQVDLADVVFLNHNDGRGGVPPHVRVFTVGDHEGSHWTYAASLVSYIKDHVRPAP